MEQKQRRLALAAACGGQLGGEPERLEEERAGRVVGGPGIIPGGCQVRHGVAALTSG